MRKGVSKRLPSKALLGQENCRLATIYIRGEDDLLAIK